jgi:SPP1 gp7 family putative phage head morphogenesis protein
MLLDVTDDRRFQRYLDDVEQRLHVNLFPILTAGIRLHAARSFIRAQDYINARGKPLLALFYRRIYRDQYQAITEQADEKAVTNFMTEQVAWLTMNAGAKITGISSTLTDSIAELILEMVRQGKSTNRIAAAISKLAPELGKKRSAVIARTETHNAAMAAVEAALKYKNIRIGSKTWVAINDNRTRPSHSAVGGTTVPFDQPFSVGGALMMRPGDGSLGAGAEEIVNCRCSILYHSEGRAPAETLEPPAPSGGELDTRRALAGSVAEQYVRDQGRLTGREHVRWIDYATGELSPYAGDGETHSVQFPPQALAWLEDASRRVEVHHNHPSDNSFSSQDLAALAGYPGMVRLYAHGAGGARYLATNATPEAGPVLDRLRTGPASFEGWLGGLGPTMADVVRSHATALAVERAGLFDYTAELSPSVAKVIKSEQARFDKMVDAMTARAKNRGLSRKAQSAAVPALIDPPGPYASLEEWQQYRAELERMDVPGLAPFIRQADANVARLSRAFKVRR